MPHVFNLKTRPSCQTLSKFRCNETYVELKKSRVLLNKLVVMVTLGILGD